MSNNSRRGLPQLSGGLFLSDSGIETTLIYRDGVELPLFAAITQMRTREGRERLVRYYERHIAIAREQCCGFVLEGPTWRASKDWCDKLGYSTRQMVDANRAATHLMRDLKARHWQPETPIVVSGCIGPRGDGYKPGELMTAEEARGYHARQIGILTEAGSEMIGALTMTSVAEATGVAKAAIEAGLPVAISFTLETDGRLPTGERLGEAIEAVDDATSGWVAYYGINCAHPDHFADVLAGGASWTQRLRSLRANASRRSHAELDVATDLDDGDPAELGAQYGALRRSHPQLAVLGGCCGTDDRHVACIAMACRG